MIATWRAVRSARRAAICPWCSWDWPTSYSHCPECAVSLEGHQRTLNEAWLAPDFAEADGAHSLTPEWESVWAGFPEVFRGPLVEHLTIVSVSVSAPTTSGVRSVGEPILRDVATALLGEQALLATDLRDPPGLTAVLPPGPGLRQTAMRGVEIALAARDAMTDAGMTGGPGHPRGFVAVNTGPLALYRNEPSLRSQCEGGALELCSALAHSLRPAEVVVSGTTHRLVRERFEGFGSTPLDRDDRSLPATVHVISGIKASVSWRDMLAGRRHPLRGRDGELGRLRELRHAARPGRGQVVHLVAEPGAGKSALLEHFVAEILGDHPDDSILRAWGSCYGGSPYELVAQLVDGDRSRAHERPLSVESATKQLAEVVTADGRRAPIAVVLDDLHWADSESLAALARALPCWREQGAFTVLAYRPSLRDRVHLPRTPDDTYIGLTPLDDASVQRVVTERNASLPPSSRAIIAVRSAGNPLYAEEAVQLLLDLDVSSPTEVSNALPATLPELLLRRVELWADRRLRRLEHEARALTFRGPVLRHLEQFEHQVGDWLDRIESGAYVGGDDAARLLWRLVDMERRGRILRWQLGAGVPRRGRLREAVDRLYRGSSAELCSSIESCARATGDLDRAAWQAFRALEQARLRDDDAAVIRFGRLLLSLEERGAATPPGADAFAARSSVGAAYERLGRLTDAELVYAAAAGAPLLLARAGWVAACHGDGDRADAHLERARQLRAGAHRARRDSDGTALALLDAQLAATDAAVRNVGNEFAARARVHSAIRRAARAGARDVARELSLLQLEIDARPGAGKVWNASFHDLLARWDQSGGDTERARFDRALARSPLPSSTHSDVRARLSHHYQRRMASTAPTRAEEDP